MVRVDTGSPLTEQWSVRDVVLGGVRYPYHLGYDCVDRIAWQLGHYDADRFLVVSDDTVLALHGADFLAELGRYAPVTPFGMPAGEGIKTLRVLADHLERAVASGASRRTVVVAFGGGVPGNLAGLLAGLLFRGVRLVHVPTTTVAAMDSTISLKQAVNSPYGKNHFGMYHQPQAVFTDVKLLRTLPGREIRSGLCEGTKNCLAIRPSAIPALREILAGEWNSPEALLWLLEESIAAKCRVTAEDPREQASGLLLEYGHTVGHAIELCDHRLRGAAGVSHGEAVAIGMVAAAHVSAAIGNLDPEHVALHEELVGALGVRPAVPEGLSVSDILDVVRADNKRGYLDVAADEAAMVLLRGPGVALGTVRCPLVPVDLKFVESAVSNMAETGGV